MTTLTAIALALLWAKLMGAPITRPITLLTDTIHNRIFTHHARIAMNAYDHGYTTALIETQDILGYIDPTDGGTTIRDLAEHLGTDVQASFPPACGHDIGKRLTVRLPRG